MQATLSRLFRYVAFIATIILVTCFSITPAQADDRSASCAIGWSKIAKSRDKSALRAFVQKCDGTASAAKARALLASPDSPGIPPKPHGSPPVKVEQLYARATAALDQKQYKGAREDFSRACMARHAASCRELGRLLISDNTDVKNPRDGRQAYRSGCELDEADSCRELSVVALNSNMGPPAPDLARFGWRKSCEKFHDGAACNRLSNSYRIPGEDPARKIDYPQALNYAGLGCAAKYEIACESARVIVSYAPLKDMKSAKEYFDKAFELNSSLVPNCSGDLFSSCFELTNYYLANYFAGNEKKVFSLSYSACKSREGPICGAAGAIVVNYGVFGFDRLAEARDLLKKGCDAHFGESCYTLSKELLNSRSGPVDASGAATAKANACQYGQKEACEAVGSPGQVSPPKTKQ
jgi:TPR repeat protein